MDDSSFSNEYDSLIKTITLPRQAVTGLQEDISANSVVACKVSPNRLSHWFFIQLYILILISLYCNTCVA